MSNARRSVFGLRRVYVRGVFTALAVFTALGVGIYLDSIKGELCPKLLYHVPMNRFEEDLAVRRGLDFAELVWWSLAKRIVSLLGQHLKWDDEQWQSMQEKFLRPNDYKAVIAWPAS